MYHKFPFRGFTDKICECPTDKRFEIWYIFYWYLNPNGLFLTLDLILMKWEINIKSWYLIKAEGILALASGNAQCNGRTRKFEPCKGDSKRCTGLRPFRASTVFSVFQPLTEHIRHLFWKSMFFGSILLFFMVQKYKVTSKNFFFPSSIFLYSFFLRISG